MQQVPAVAVPPPENHPRLRLAGAGLPRGPSGSSPRDRSAALSQSCNTPRLSRFAACRQLVG
jgi:hypothetical protein